jgi:hypothetical protein
VNGDCSKSGSTSQITGKQKYLWNVAKQEGYQVLLGLESSSNVLNQPFDSLDFTRMSATPDSLWGQFQFPAVSLRDGEKRKQQCIGDQHVVEKVRRCAGPEMC